MYSCGKNMGLLGLLLIPFAIGAISWKFFGATITVKEYLLMCVATVLIGLGSWQIAKYAGMQDIEHWNGRIVDKDEGTQSCCHCSTVCDATDKDGNCTSSHEECDHFHDYWYSLDVSTGDVLDDSCNGFDSPPSWWTKAELGDPATVEHIYTNYLKADDSSLFVPGVGDKYLDVVPDRWPKVHDKYKVKRALGVQASVPRGWQKALDELNADLGSKKQLDLLVVVTSIQDPEFADSIEKKWLYGPKNALTVVLGVKDGEVTWARAVTISKVETLKINIRDELPGMKTAGLDVPQKLRGMVMKDFTRTPLAEFSYLAENASPEGWALLLTYLLNILAVIGLAYWFHREDVA